MVLPAFTPPPYPREFDADTLNRSVAELDGPAELRRLLAHGRGVRWVLPLALARLEREPFLTGDYAPGDVLSAMLALGPDDSTWTPARRALLGRVLAGAWAGVGALADPDRTRIADDLEAARELFGDAGDDVYLESAER